jgi:hypothetical protein
MILQLKGPAAPEGWVIDAFNEESRMKIGNLSKGQQTLGRKIPRPSH